MGTIYNHLSLEERCRMTGMIEMGLPVAEIARRLGRHRGTIHRELDRNHLAGTQGDAINVILAAVGYNFSLLLR